MSDDLFTTSGTLLAWLGLAVFLLALCADSIRQRVHKRRRCPKCWYDLSHTPGLACSECGYTAKRERKLYKARKRWRLVWLAIVLLLGSYGLRVTPTVRDRGWPAVVPTTVLIVIAPYLTLECESFVSPGAAQRRYVLGLSETWNESLPEIQKPPDPSFEAALFIECYWNRFDKSQLSRWQVWLARQVLNRDDGSTSVHPVEYPSLRHRLIAAPNWLDQPDKPWLPTYSKRIPRVRIKTRDHWPSSEPIVATVSIDALHGIPAVRVIGEPLTGGLDKFEFIAQRQRTHRGMKFDLDRILQLGAISKPVKQIQYRVSIYRGEENSQLNLVRYRHLRTTVVNIPRNDRRQMHDIVEPVSNEATTRWLAQHLTPRVSGNRFVIPKQNNFHRRWKEFDGIALACEVTVYHGIRPVGYGTIACEIESFTSDHPEELEFLNPSGTGFDEEGQLWMLTRDNEISVSIDWINNRFPRYDDGKWTATLRGDPEIALRNFDCDRYWAGEVTVPLKVDLE